MKNKWRNAPVHIGLWITLIILLFPVWIMISTSLQKYEDVFNWPPDWLPNKPEWINFVNVWLGDYSFHEPFFNSIIISVSTALISIVIAFPAAYALTRFKFKAKNLLLLIVLVTQMFSPIILIVGLFQLIQTYNLLNTLIGVIITNSVFTTPMAVWLMYGYLQSIPVTLEQAAFVDGASRFKSIIRITFPLAAPGVAMAGIYAFIMSWNDLIIPLILISEDSLRPISLALTDFAGQNVVYWHEMMAASVISTLPVAILFSFVQNLFVKGFMSGAVKE
ncbi:MAG TPA: carbohydrate ABC transporter permease [Lentibacillus sp.]|uniref:carbohydrate ABC transporter permease n=1 Tax=Lentibacillus sp. TaxID=1925746 RepID=UPI002B4B8DE3|nr:carbohydrate ABC transporter permease [Lentibacillus sp.]HLR62144.1 carbohydrate ABC transporter permease [Lentibacillus sp.]